jgi:hypothetical protein
MGTRIGEKPSVYNSDYVPTHNKAVLGAPAGLGRGPKPWRYMA